MILLFADCIERRLQNPLNSFWIQSLKQHRTESLMNDRHLIAALWGSFWFFKISVLCWLKFWLRTNLEDFLPNFMHFWSRQFVAKSCIVPHLDTGPSRDLQAQCANFGMFFRCTLSKTLIQIHIMLTKMQVLCLNRVEKTTFQWECALEKISKVCALGEGTFVQYFLSSA